VKVAPARGLDIHWRPFGLVILNGGPEKAPEQWRPAAEASFGALRLIASLAGQDDVIGRFYTEIGARTRALDAPLSPEIVLAAAEAAGNSDTKAVQDESLDAAVHASHDEAFGSAALTVCPYGADGYPPHMVEPQVSLDPQTLSPVEQKLQGPLEDQLSSALAAAYDKVSERYAGEDVDRLTEQLLAETRSHLHPDIAAGFQPDQAELRRVAEAIIAGER
jgi:mycothiol-dependent nitroreductase-like protein